MATANPAELARPKQNWVVDPVSDIVFIIAAPLLAFVWALLTLNAFGSEFVWTIFSVFNVAHHMPTFIRIYGDKELFSRFRWSLILGPVIPLTAGFTLSYYTLSNGYPISTLFLIMMFLTVWDPWHFLMQHYGFMRIYDRHNAAPRRLASWMDYSVSLAWFTFIMLATGEWLFEGLLHRLFTDSGFPLLLWLDPAIYHAVLNVFLALAVTVSLAYIGYTIWCYSKGYFVSPAKLILVIITFAMMYVTYVPTSFFRANFPEWTYQVGFATLGMVHVTQYLAIVWKFNRGLASRGESRSRKGLFSYAFSRGGLLIAVGYVAICLVYGALLTHNKLVEAQSEQGYTWFTAFSCIVLCISFTSTLMHYYYDGFIWKLRHKENSENLEDRASRGKQVVSGSWWERMGQKSLWARFKADTFGATLLRQCLYFGVPLGLLTVLFFYVGQNPRSVAHNTANLDGLIRISEKYEQEPSAANLEIAQNLVQRMDRQIIAEQRMAELNPGNRVGHEVELALLTYARAWGKMAFIVGPDPTSEQLAEYRTELEKAVTLMEKHFDPSIEPRGEMQEQLKFYWQTCKDQLAQIDMRS